ncbi:HNH endonuclease [Pseudomonas aeruginosa]|uniref:HNH endonuclease n=1 Tax=Pseudomonas aeruginosa TaxID=287 RepID=UPI0003B9F1C2|nr:HNH endonuclease [Pseudomonas aeruginosa]ERV90342.1 hypothetical protein Q039_03713 [Pseudomonas aeruginosa BWHPSA026]ETU71230.1 hypothetical protein Q095_06293 [Pseudomonas aeruginosa PS50]ETV16611.1 hypothetical protein Q048_06115 [Pseudomonas aeruginosa BWHPSA043]KRU56416.1 hypothetical protein AN450_29070 [Pseudomonas aeruginosa]MCT5521278.1 HNH endonuclease [Pseudomonas aeruginosa]
MKKAKKTYQNGTGKQKPLRGSSARRGWRAWSEYVSAFLDYIVPEPPHVDSIACVPAHIRLPDAAATAAEDDLLLRRLYILEPEDLLEFTLDDLLLAWRWRFEVCGSEMAAAELYALYRVATGQDEVYQGGAHFEQALEVLAIFDPEIVLSEDGSRPGHEAPLQDTTPDPDPPPVSPLSLEDVRSLSASVLMRAWEDRPESFASLEAAAEALALLRVSSSADSEKKSLSYYLRHPLILDLEEYLPGETSRAEDSAAEARLLDLMQEDRRKIKVQSTVVRTGQQDFRSEVFRRYGGICCVTGCTIASLLEAAHIIPYRGSHTDHVENGLLLRVDIHRLFDDHLISIDPVRLALIVSGSIEDASYRELHGRPLFRLSAKPNALYLEDHYRRYQRAEHHRAGLSNNTSSGAFA